MQTKKTYIEDEFERDNVHNEEDRDGIKEDSSIWYN